jgi:hypothetical protein
VGGVRQFWARAPTIGNDRVTGKQTRKVEPKLAEKVGRALRRAAKDARRTARMHGVPIYVWENGKVVALKP